MNKVKIDEKVYEVPREVAVYIWELWQVYQSVCTRITEEKRHIINNAGPQEPEIELGVSSIYRFKDSDGDILKKSKRVLLIHQQDDEKNGIIKKRKRQRLLI